MTRTAEPTNFELSQKQGAIALALLFAAAWAALYGPVYYEFANGPWQRDENAHAPFMMAICVGAAWARLTQPGFSFSAGSRSLVAGMLVLALGLGVFALGRIGELELFLSGSQTFVLAGAALAFFGAAGARALWFPISLSAYLVIWPGWALDTLTSPLKRLISETVSDGLYAAGLPVAHAGAVISAGPYQLLVADACAGLNSLIALTAIGAVYLYVARRASRRVNAAVIASLIPIAIAANAIRVALLVLITYFFGYDAGQSFLHDGAGLFMFGVALAGVFLVDIIAAKLWEPRS